MSIKRFVPMTACALLLGACSSVPYAQRLSERQAAYTAAAGAPVRNFRFFDLYSWVPVSDTELAVYTRPDQAWLLDTDGCQNLQFAQTIGLTSMFDQVSIGFDKVLVGRDDFPCTIRQIRPVDVKSLKDMQQQQRKIHAASRGTEKSSAG